MAARTFSAGTAFLTVVPSFLNIEDAFKKQVRQMAAAADRDLAAGMARGLKEANRQAKGAGAKAGGDFAGAYESEAKRTLVKAFRSLPEPQPGVNLRKWDKALAQVRTQIKELSEQQIGIDINQRDFDTAVDQMRRKLEELRATAPTDRGWFNANQAAESLREVQRFTDDVSRRTGEAGAQAGSAFHQGMAKALRAGLAGLPPIKLTADSSDAERALAALAQRMLTLQSKRIGVDIDAAAAYAELRAIHNELQRLDRANVRVDIRTNAHEAAAGLAGFIQQAEQAGRSTESIGHRAQFSMSRLEYLIALGASVGTAIVPAAAAAAGAIGFIGTAALGAISGLGVLALGTSGVADAVKALNGYQQDQLKSTNSLNQAQRRLASSADQIRMAELALGNTRRNIAEQAEDAARRVADAERGVADARRQARMQLVEADRAVRDAQRAVTEAESDARDVRQDLNEAIREATRNMRELDTSLKRNAHEQEQAVTAQMEALEALNRLRANPRATELELRRAQESYDEQTIRLEELRNQHQRLAEDKARYDKDGVEGDEQVIAARERIAEADERVGRARERLDREQEQRREAEYQASRRVADAQRQLADAQRAQARQQLDAQFQLSQATNALESAKRSEAQAWEQAGAAGGAALEKLNEEMSELSPAGQRFARFLFGLKDEVLGLRAAAAEPLLPRLEEAITHGLQYLPGFSDFIGRVAAKTGDLAIATVDAFGNPVWRRFFSYVDRTAVPSLQTLFETGSNVTEGLLSLFLALTPFNEPVGTGLVELSRDFAQWAERLNRTQGYQDFLAYIQENGPRVVELLGEAGELLIKVVEAAAPLGSLTLRGLTLLIDLLNSIPTPALTALVFAIAGVSLAMTTLGAIMRVIKLRQQLTEIFGPRMASLVQTYAVETGRATEQTSRFGRATATVSGMTAAAGTRLRGFGDAAGVATTRASVLAATVGGPLRRGMDVARTAALSTAIAMNGPGGVAGAVQSAQARVIGLAAGAEVAVNRGLNPLRMAAFNTAIALNGPGGVASAVQVAGTQLRNFGTGAARVATSGLAAVGRGAQSLVGFLGGPWGVALAAATIGIGVLVSATASYNAKIDELSTSFKDLGHTYHDLADQGKLGGREAQEALEGIVEHNPAMQRAVVLLNELGIEFDQVARAAAGSKPDLDAALARIDAEIAATEEQWRDASNFLTTVWTKEARGAKDRLDNLRQTREALMRNKDALDIQARAQQLATESTERYQAVQGIVNNNTGTSTSKIFGLTGAYDANAQKIGALTNLLKVFGSNTSDAALRSDALRQAIDAQTGAAVRAIEADESFAQQLINLRDQVNSAKAAHDKHATSLDLNSATALRNRDALQAAATGARNLYLEDIAAGVPMDQATKRHKTRIDTLKEEAKRLGLTKTEAALLIKTYGEVDPTVETVYKTKDFQKVYLELERLKFIQEALAKGWSVAKAEAEWKNKEWWKKGFQGPIQQKAEGGLLRGPGTETSDSFIAAVSDYEYVQPANAVHYYGVDTMEALRKKRIPREALQGFATGGLVRNPFREYPMTVNAGVTRIPSMDEVIAAATGVGSLGAASGGPGWRWQMAVLRKIFPGLALYSGYRQNSYTSSGSLSWHSRDGGRAVDIPPRADVFRWIHDTYGRGTKELIWGGNPSMNIYRGQHHKFSDSLLYAHGPYKGVQGPSPHIHWAFDDGGYLPPGLNITPNWTGQPEPVLNATQWDDIHKLAMRGADATMAGNTYQFTFADTTLTPGRLRAMQERDAAMARVGRPR